MILKVLLTLLIFINEIRSSLNSKNYGSSDKSTDDTFESPVSTNFLADSPDLTLLRKSFKRNTVPGLGTISADLVLYIGEYLEFPHVTFGLLNRGIRDIFKTLTPSRIISNQLEFPELRNLQKSRDLKYLLTLDRSVFTDEKILTIIVDVALVKSLPIVKGPLLRLLYERVKSTVNRELLFKLIHPYKNIQHSTISALIIGFTEIRDYEMVFDILENYPEIIINDYSLFSDQLIKAADRFGKLKVIYEAFSRNPFITMQEKFDFTCKCLGLTLNPEILNLFLKEAYKPNELWMDNYCETFLNAWIHAFTFSADKINLDFAGLKTFVDEIKADWNVHVAVRKQTLLLILAIRSGQPFRPALETFLNNFSTITFKYFYEEILWALVVEEQYEDFLFFLQVVTVIESTRLRTAIAKAPSQDFMTEFMERFNVNRLFSNNFYGEAIYNQKLFLKLTGFSSEENYFENCLLNSDLFKYAMIHLKDDWSKLFESQRYWSAISFADLIQFLLNNHRSMPLFEQIINLLSTGSISIATWGRPKVHLLIEAAEFLLGTDHLRVLIPRLNHIMEFSCEPNVMAHLITMGICVLRLLRFSVNDLLIQLPHWKDHEKYMRLFGLSFQAYLKQLKGAMNDLKLINAGTEDQEAFDRSLVALFNPTLSRLKWTHPVDYLLLLPYSVLMRTISHDPDYMKKAIEWALDNRRTQYLFHAVRGHVIKVRGPFDKESLISALKRCYKIRILIV